MSRATMGEKRNFRSSYYDKVGFRGVEEKKSLEEIFAEKPMDKEKLSKFCQRFTLPAIYREYVWEVLLGVLPLNSESNDSFLAHRSEHYQDMERDLKTMRLIEEDTPKPVVHTLMFIINDDILDFDIQKQLSSPKTQIFIALASFFLEMSSSEMIAFWLFRNFILNQKMNLLSNILKEVLETFLKKEDEVLYEHLKSIRALETLPLENWFKRYFVEVLHESSLIRVFDKVIGGSCKVLPYVAAALLMSRKNLLLPLSDVNKIVNILEKNPEDISDLVVNKALDLYYSLHQ